MKNKVVYSLITATGTLYIGYVLFDQPKLAIVATILGISAVMTKLLIEEKTNETKVE